MERSMIQIERKFRPEIEGLRVVAALLVAIYHIWLNKVSGGVDVFFVISGFLITTSIISTINRTGEFNFIPYITKLLKRLLPNVFFILGIVLILSSFFIPSSILKRTIYEVIASMFYYQNWQLAISSTDYLDATQMKTPVEHFWALSIQGQFYIIWFLLFLFILFVVKKNNKVNGRKLTNIVLGTVFILSFIYSIYLTKANQPLAYFITFTRVWEFALGGLICVNLSSIKINKLFATLIGWVGLIGLLLTGILFNVSEMFPGYIALWPMMCAFFIVLAGTHDTRFGVKVFLAAPFMVKLGGISFGIYLWHWVILQFYRYNIETTPSVSVGILIILVSIVLAYITTEFIEKPIRNAKSNKGAFRRIVTIGIINSLIIMLLFTSIIKEENKFKNLVIDENYPGALATQPNVDTPDNVEAIPPLSQAFEDLPVAHLDGMYQSLNKSDLIVGEYGETENYSKTIAIVGSSHSEHWFGAILEAVKDTDYRVLAITRSGTRFSTIYSETDLTGIWNQHVIDYLRDADVDLVFSHATVSNVEEKKIHQGIIDQLQYVYDEYNIDILAIRDNPRYSFSVLESLETQGYETTKDLMNKEKHENQKDKDFWEKFEEENVNFYTMDLSDFFKIDNEYDPIIGNVVVYRDAKHMTNTFSTSLAPIFREKFAEIFGKTN